MDIKPFLFLFYYEIDFQLNFLTVVKTQLTSQKFTYNGNLVNLYIYKFLNNKSISSKKVYPA